MVSWSMSARKAYPSDLRDEQWELIKGLVPEPLSGGRPAKYARREVVNAILYVLRSGCAWRMMPHDLPPKETAYACFALWDADGTWEKIEETLRRRVRKREGKRPAPTAAIIDSQAVKTSDQGGPRGFDVAKQTIGRKRHVLVDTLGLIWLVQVTAASVQDRDGALLLFAKLCQRGLGRVRLIWADSAYRAQKLWDWLAAHLPRRGLRLELVERDAAAKGFVVLKGRWVVERTFGWLNKCRRLSKDYERKTRHSEAMIRLASIQLMLRRLTLKAA